MADLVEIAAVKVKGGKITDRWSTFVNPGRPIVGNQMHGITDEDVKKAPTPGRGRQAGRSTFVGDAPIVGHSVGFDLALPRGRARRRHPLRAGPLPRHAGDRPRGLPGPRELQARRRCRTSSASSSPRPTAPLPGRRGDREPAHLVRQRPAGPRSTRSRTASPTRSGPTGPVATPRRLLEAARREARVSKSLFSLVHKKTVRQLVLDEGIRMDGRGLTELRPISVEVGLAAARARLRPVHPRRDPGADRSRRSARPRTSSASTRSARRPRSATSTTTTSRPTARARTSRCAAPAGATSATATWPSGRSSRSCRAHEEFPYVIRLVSECVSSNGSTSMASTCGSTLALMDAGVPITAPVAGAAMGLISEPDGRFVVLTDILGKEDSVGDMDFKVTGTRDGITALQMDIKVQGINEAIIRDGLKQALAARLEILDKMTEVMPEARSDMSDFAPRIITIKINPEKIREIIGKGGSMIRKIQEETQTEINVEDDGTVEIAAVSGENSRKAIEWIESLTREVEIGALYLGKVTRIMGFGAFVEILPGKEGLVRIGELADYHVPDRRGRRVRRRRGHGRRDRDRPPGPRQPVAQGRDAAPPGEGPRRSRRRIASTDQRRAAGRPAAPVSASVGPSGCRAGKGPLVYSRRARPSDRASGAMPPMNRNPLTVAVVGATGVVGRTMIQVLNEREFPVGELRLLASGRSAGRTRVGRRADARDRRGDARTPSTASTSRCSPPAPTSRGSSRPSRGAWRDGHRQLVGVADGPGGPARGLAGQPGRPRGPRGHHRQPELLDDAARAGADGAARHASGSSGSSSTPTSPCRGPAPTPSPSSRARSGRTSPASRSGPTVYPHPIAFNALPEIDVFLPNGYTKEEWKVVNENRKILDLPDLRISCTAVRIPVFVSHSEAVHVETRDPITPERARSCSPRSPASSSRTTRRPTSTRWRPRPPAATRSSWARPPGRLDPGRPRPRLLGRLGQPPQGRGDERRRARGGPRRARLGRARLGQGRPSVPGRGAGGRRRQAHGVTDAERRAALEAIAAEVRVCTRCRLHETRTQGGPGRGRSRHRGRLRRRGTGLQRGPAGPAVRRSRRRPARQAAGVASAGGARTSSSRTSSSAGRPTTATRSPTRSRPARRTCTASSRCSIRRWS